MPCFILTTGPAGLPLAHEGRRPSLCAPRATNAEGTNLTLSLKKRQMHPLLFTHLDGSLLS